MRTRKNTSLIKRHPMSLNRGAGAGAGAASAAAAAVSRRGGFEENIMAILDSSSMKDSRDILDDRVSFLDAVRSAFVHSDACYPPSRNIWNAIFQILKDSKSLELAMASYHLLIQLHEHYSGIHIAAGGELVLDEEAWLPFIIGSEASHVYKGGDNLIDPAGFCLLVEDIAKAIHESHAPYVLELLEKMLLFQYLVYFLEKDFLLRQSVYKESLQWSIVRESILNILLGSKRLNFKVLAKTCILIVQGRRHHYPQKLKNTDLSSTNVSQNYDMAIEFAIVTHEDQIYGAFQKLFTHIMDIDALRKSANLQGLTSRVDDLRIPLMEIILEELTYNKDGISSFLVAFSDPKWKLEIVLEYLKKYIVKPCVRTRRTVDCSDNFTFETALNLFSTEASTKDIIKMVPLEVVQLLIAHAYQAYLSLLHSSKVISDCPDISQRSSITEICKGLASSYRNLKNIYPCMEMTPFEKEAFFTAATLSHFQGSAGSNVYRDQCLSIPDG